MKFRHILKRLLADVRNVKKIKRFFYKGLTENLTLKLISAVMTLTLFILIAGESVQISKTVKIVYSTGKDVMIVNHVPFEFEMILSGPKSSMGLIRGRDFTYKVNLVNANEGTSRIRVQPRELGLMRGVLVSSLMPSVLYPRLEKIVKKEVPIYLKSHGSPNYKLKKITLSREKVSVSGPSSEVKKIEQLVTEPFDLAHIKKSGEYSIRIKIPGDMLSIADPVDGVVKVVVELLK